VSLNWLLYFQYHMKKQMSMESMFGQRFRHFKQKAKISPKMKDLFSKEFRIQGISVYF